MEFVELIAYFIGDIKPDGLEVVLASKSSKERKKSKHPEELSSFINTGFTAETRRQRSMELSISKLLHVVGERLPRRARTRVAILRSMLSNKRVPCSIYVLTDGAWTGHRNTETCGVDIPIRGLMDQMHAQGSRRTDVAIQFVQFGTDPVGHSRLEYLNNSIAIDPR